ncbi:MAG: hypothetical protein JWM58_2774 [Rhizobium sp.]|nr:hypothetical protein [Rhizobium sp.]
MGKYQNGIDGAIALLLALVRHNGEAPVALLVKECGLARASLYRIARILADAGLVGRTRGKLIVGPAGAAFATLQAKPQRKHVHPGAHRLTPSERSREKAESGPIVLSAPLVSRRNGRYRIGFSNASLSNPWRFALVHSVEFAAARLGRAVHKFTIRHANEDAAQQIADIDDLLSEGVDGLIVSAVVPDIVGPAVARAMAAGIPVVLVDRGVAEHVPHTSFVCSDDAGIGRLSALWLCERLKGQGAVLMLPGHSEAEPARKRLAAAQLMFANFPEIEILPVEWTGWDRQRAREIVTDHLLRMAPISGVWCDSGLQGVGSLQAFNDFGTARGEFPPHTGGDLNLAYKLAIRHQVPLAAVDYPAAMGYRAMDILHAALRGQWVPSRVDVPLSVAITKGAATRSLKPDCWAEDRVRWDLPDDLVFHSGLGEGYNPRTFRIHYPGNSYNRSAARAIQ